MKTSEILQSVLAVGKYLESNPQKPITNADRIRAMTDEELAYFIACDYYVPHCPIADGCLGDHEGCDGCWLEWLKQEAET